LPKVGRIQFILGMALRVTLMSDIPPIDHMDGPNDEIDRILVLEVLQRCFASVWLPDLNAGTDDQHLIKARPALFDPREIRAGAKLSMCAMLGIVFHVIGKSHFRKTGVERSLALINHRCVTVVREAGMDMVVREISHSASARSSSQFRPSSLAVPKTP